MRFFLLCLRYHGMVTAQCQVESLIIAVIMRMKFFTTAAIFIATAAAAVAAYEVPSDIIIPDLVDEYDSEMNWGPSGSSYDEDEGYVDFEDEEQPTSNYGLRGSSFDEQSEANEKWKTTYCQAEKRAAVWEQRMKEGTKEERAKARERYAEAKAASAKAWSRISKEGKSAWDAVKNKSTSIGKSIGKKTETWGKKAAGWFRRHGLEDEDEFEEVHGSRRSVHCMFVK